jgi:hypothetical protein
MEDFHGAAVHLVHRDSRDDGKRDCARRACGLARYRHGLRVSADPAGWDCPAQSDGLPDCPDASASGVIDDTARGLARGLDALRREVERLGEGYNQRR